MPLRSPSRLLPGRVLAVLLVFVWIAGARCGRMQNPAQILDIQAPDSVLVGTLFPVKVVVFLPNPCWRLQWLSAFPTRQGYQLEGEIVRTDGICPQYTTSTSTTLYLWAWPRQRMVLSNPDGTVQETVWVKG